MWDGIEPVGGVYMADEIKREGHLANSSYYDAGGVSVLDIWKSKMSKEEFEGLCKGMIIKYICRAGVKDPTKEVEDLKKTKQYLEWLIESKEESK